MKRLSFPNALIAVSASVLLLQACGDDTKVASTTPQATTAATAQATATPAPTTTLPAVTRIVNAVKDGSDLDV